MLEEWGVVVTVDGDFAWVETRRASACGSCSSGAACGTSVLAKVLGQKPNQVRVRNTRAAQVGDRVLLGVQEQALVRGSLWLYLMPLGLMFAAALGYEALAGQWWPAGDGYTALAGLAGLALGFFWINASALRMALDPRYQPIMLEVRRGADSHSITWVS
jgi:sigma-E factor negative regulatory protein RseC